MDAASLSSPTSLRQRTPVAEATSSGITLFSPEPQRVVLRPFFPAENGTAASRENRVDHILDRVLALAPADLDRELDHVLQSLNSRHRDVESLLGRRFDAIAGPHLRGQSICPSQRLLCGAYFTEEYSFEAAALFNPSVTPHPDQSGLAAGETRLLFSLRAIGEGHISSIVFRTGVTSADGGIRVDPPSRWAVSPAIEFSRRPRSRIAGSVHLSYSGCDDPSEVVIFPVTYQQRHGVEDLRLVRFVEDDGHVLYIGTYTAFSGETVRQELLRTSDFVDFDLDPLEGPLSATKGMALFPRRIDGQYAMLGRHDHENIWLLKSDTLTNWSSGEIVLTPQWPWEFVQVGACGPPIEIEEGWLCITHGVGSIRTYCLGACLLDKQNPAKLLARSVEPLLRPSPQQRDGYVPNVLYSCGALVAGRNLLLPYGVADSQVAFTALPLAEVLSGLR